VSGRYAIKYRLLNVNSRRGFGFNKVYYIIKIRAKIGHGVRQKLGREKNRACFVKKKLKYGIIMDWGFLFVFVARTFARAQYSIVYIYSSNSIR